MKRSKKYWINYLELLQQFTITNLKQKYKKSILGLLWYVLKPLCLFIIIYFVWSAIIGRDPNYKMNLLLGIMMFHFLQEGVLSGMQSLQQKAHIILKINFPKEIVVISTIAIAAINFIINMGVFCVFRIFTKTDINSIGIILFLFSVFSLFLIITGVSFFLSILLVKFQDLHQIIEVFLQLLFWLTPIFYNVNMLPGNFKKLVMLNPLTPIITLARKGLILASTVRMADFQMLLMVTVIGFLLSVSGYFFFKKNVIKIAEYY